VLYSCDLLRFELFNCGDVGQVLGPGGCEGGAHVGDFGDEDCGCGGGGFGDGGFGSGGEGRVDFGEAGGTGWVLGFGLRLNGGGGGGGHRLMQLGLQALVFLDL
jgi:hypothetical protein